MLLLLSYQSWNLNLAGIRIQNCEGSDWRQSLVPSYTKRGAEVSLLTGEKRHISRAL